MLNQSENRELLTALIFGLKEFIRQKNVKNIVIGMSGGIDSSLVAYLCVKAIGPDHVLGVNMPTKFNSSLTKTIAQTVAKNLGIAYRIIPIEDIADLLRQKLSVTSGDRLIDENLQARIRSADILAGIAAKYDHAIYTCNGNKSEIALGWFTIDGDGRGAICPIGDLYKTQIFDLAAYINTLEKVFPDSLFTLIPSAELSQNQVDPFIYPYHDQLLKQFIEYRQNPEDVLRNPKFAKEYFPNPKDFILDLEKIWTLFHRAIYKQIQSPPIISVSKRAFGYDFRRSQTSAYLTKKYYTYKNRLLKHGY